MFWEMIKVNYDLLEARFEASKYLADILAYYASIEVQYRDLYLMIRNNFKMLSFWYIWPF